MSDTHIHEHAITPDDGARIEPTARDQQAESEAAVCFSCAERERRDEDLTNDLRRLRRCAESLDAPPEIEAALRAAFRSRAAANEAPRPSLAASSPRRRARLAPAARATAANASRLSDPTRANRSSSDLFASRAAGVAAVLCAVAIVALASLASFEPRPAIEPPLAVRTPIIAEREPTVIEHRAPLVPLDSRSGLRQIAPAGDSIFGAEETRTSPRAARARTAASSRAPAVARFASAAEPRPYASRSYEETPAEIATEFLPLLEAGSSAPIESGQIVRVRLPRQSLVALGLPMNPERAGEPVTADVLLGEDGVARAIRFVR